MTKSKELKPDQIITLDIFRHEVAVFKSFDAYTKYFYAMGVYDLPVHGEAAAAISAMFMHNGSVNFVFVIPEGAPMGHVAHEACHMADYVCDYFGIPIDFENHEIRGYLTGHFVHELCGEKW